MANSNVNIADNLLAYLAHSVDFTSDIKDIYTNSLIFIGDEQQIYVPAFNTYVGVSKSKYEELVSKINTLENKRYTQRSVANISGSHVINNIAIDPSTGELSYTFHNLYTTEGSFRSNETLSSLTKLNVIGGINQSADGKISYTYYSINIPGSSDLSGSVGANGDFVTSVTLNSNGTLTGTTGTFSSEGTSSNSLKYVSNLILDNTGKLSYTYGQLSFANQDHTIDPLPYTYIESDGITVIKEVHLSQGGTFSYSKVKLAVKDSENASYLTYIERETNTDRGTYVVTNIYKNPTTNKFTFVTNDLTTTGGTLNTGNVPPYSASFNPTGMVIPNGVFAFYVYGQGIPIINGINQSADGKISYTYSFYYLNPQQFKYTYLYLDPSHSTYTSTGDFVDVLSGWNMSAGGLKESFGFSYGITSVPTKKYIDALIAANDAMRYCGTVSGASSANGPVTFTHVQNPGPGHGSSIPDYSTGAVYKVSSAGYFATTYVVPGDMIISMSDSATATPDLSKWNVINENLNLRTTFDGNTGSGTTQIITGVNLSGDGHLSYITGSLRAFKGGETNSNAVFETAGTGITPLNTNTTSTGVGVKVVTDVSIQQSNLDTKLYYTYSYIYTDLSHHSTSTPTKASDVTLTYSTYTNVITGVNLSSTGTLTYTYTPININNVDYATTATYIDRLDKNFIVGTPSSTMQGVVHDVSLVDNVITVTYSKVGATGTESDYSTNGIDDVDLIESIFQNTWGSITYVKRNNYDFSKVKTTNLDRVSYFVGITKEDGGNGSGTLQTHLNRRKNAYIYDTNKFYVDYTYVGQNLKVGGTTTIGSTLSVGGNASITGSLTVTSSTSLKGDMYFGDGSDDSLFLRSANITLPASNSIDFTNLKSLWGTIS